MKMTACMVCGEKKKATLFAWNKVLGRRNAWCKACGMDRKAAASWKAPSRTGRYIKPNLSMSILGRD
jgi:hypothetical protein